MKKRGFLVLLFVLIHLVACTKKPIEVVENTLAHENNKYVCEELKFPEGDEKESIGLKLMNYNDTLRYIKGNEAEKFIEYFAYDLNNEGSWDKIDLEWGKSKEWTKNTSLSNFSYTLQGDLYALKYTVISQDKIKKELCQLKDDGTIRIVPLNDSYRFSAAWFS